MRDRMFMNERDGFKVGDRVKVKNYYIAEMDGMVGTIFKIDDDHCLNFDVILDNFTEGHNGHAGDTSTNHRFFDIENLELLNSTQHNVGDLVQVRSYLSTEKSYGGIYPSEQMLHKVGQTVRIKAVTKTGRYKIEGSCFTWTNEMFEEAKNETKVEDKPTYKVGDRVKITRGYLVDNTGVIRNLKDGSIWDVEVIVDNLKDGHSGTSKDNSTNHWYFTFDEIEKIENEEKPIPNIKVGDVVRAIDNNYGITALRNEWEGVVIFVFDGKFTAITTNHKNLTGYKYDRFHGLNPKHFEIIKKNN